MKFLLVIVSAALVVSSALAEAEKSETVARSGHSSYGYGGNSGYGYGGNNGGYGYGYGSGGNGGGNGGWGYGKDNGYGYGHGKDNGYGYGHGKDNGYGYGHGKDNGYGYGKDNGYGYGYGGNNGGNNGGWGYGHGSSHGKGYEGSCHTLEGLIFSRNRAIQPLHTARMACQSAHNLERLIDVLDTMITSLYSHNKGCSHAKTEYKNSILAAKK